VPANPSNPKQFWRWINTGKGYREPIPLLHNCGNTITKDSEKASLFNKYFCSVFSQENTSNLDSLTPDSIHPAIVDLISITAEEVYAELSNLNVNKAYGPDRITSKVLQISFLYHSAVYLINHNHRTLFLSIGFQQILFQYTSAMTSIILVTIDQLVSNLLSVRAHFASTFSF